MYEYVIFGEKAPGTWVGLSCGNAAALSDLKLILLGRGRQRALLCRLHTPIESIWEIFEAGPLPACDILREHKGGEGTAP